MHAPLLALLSIAVLICAPPVSMLDGPLGWSADAPVASIARVISVEVIATRPSPTRPPVPDLRAAFRSAATPRPSIASSAAQPTPTPSSRAPASQSTAAPLPSSTAAPVATPAPTPTPAPPSAAAEAGLATWYCCTLGYRGQPVVALPAALGGHYDPAPAERSITICADRCAEIAVVDFCSCYWGTEQQRIADLSPEAWALISDAPLSRGTIWVELHR